MRSELPRAPCAPGRLRVAKLPRACSYALTWVWRMGGKPARPLHTYIYWNLHVDQMDYHCRVQSPVRAAAATCASRRSHLDGCLQVLHAVEESPEEFTPWLREQVRMLGPLLQPG